jgi:hypothetical protein
VLVGARDLAHHGEGAGFEVDVRPLESHALALAEAERQSDGEQGPEPVPVHLLEQGTWLADVQRIDLRVLVGNRGGQPGGVAGQVPVAFRHVQTVPENRADLRHRRAGTRLAVNGLRGGQLGEGLVHVHRVICASRLRVSQSGRSPIL